MKLGNYLSDISKVLLPVVFVVVLLIVFWNKIQSLIKQIGWNEQSKQDENLSDRKVIYSFITRVDSDYVTFAENLHLAMRGVGTDEKTIIAILNKLNAEEFKLVYLKFGKKLYDKVFGVSDIPIIGQKYDLLTWLKSECSDKMYQSIKTRFAKSYLPFP
jgi:hypothetical protein